MTRHSPGGTTFPPGYLMAIPVDPDLGFVQFEFAVASDSPDQPDKVVLGDVDVYHAAELFNTVQKRYFAELEAAGRQEEASRHESLRRWVALLFKSQPQVPVDKLSFGAMAAVQKGVYEEIERLSATVTASQ